MNLIFRVLDSWFVPVLVAVAYGGLIATASMTPVMMVLTAGFFGLVLVLWQAFRELKLHATAQRHAAVGDPDELLALSDEQLARRWRARAKVPFHVYRAIAFELRGDHAAAQQALDATQLDLLPVTARRSWGALHAAVQISLLAHAGDGAAAREVLDDKLRPALSRVPGAGAEILLREAEARVLVAEGKLDEARPHLEALAKDIRLGAATRAACKHLLGDHAAAAKLAPRTWMARSGKSA